MFIGGLIAGILQGSAGIINTLPQESTNGKSLWGTLSNPYLPPFLTNNPLPGGFPWGSLTAGGSNPYTSAPDTGVVRSYDFTITRGKIAPDGYSRDVILINGQYPGPLIEANWGTAMHWHGLLQKGTQYMDGVPAVSQCPIAPGDSFTYTFKADLYGSSWYHSHYSAQYAGGLVGPMVIHGPSNAPYDVDLGPVLLMASGAAANPRPVSDNNLINGKMSFDCAAKANGDNTECSDLAGISQFKFQTGKTHRLRLINAGSEGMQRFSIDGHKLVVIANDFVPIKPYTTNVVTLAVGQRADVLPLALAAVYYDQADTTKSPQSTPWDVPDPGTCANDDLSITEPYYSIAAPEPATTQNMDINYYVNDTGHFLWTLGGTSFRANYNKSPPPRDKGNTPTQKNGTSKTLGPTPPSASSSTTPPPLPTLCILHGHNMQILSEGPGDWDGTTITRQNNPQRRDVQIVRPNGHFVWQITTDNQESGLSIVTSHGTSVEVCLRNVLERPLDIQKSVKIPRSLENTCKRWNAYTNSATVDEIDSGI
ncbi:hypothetical protein DID88_004366 [Monilinia fructigena]|uniref:Plastocyanin-like domain-containing protein n=1 Tax=Monilinia fructigena TaxID=38457 RepID=A0A395ISJ7_9HELO|nr:hypothetical protein DID88_004366 [Monilinia fructigena]